MRANPNHASEKGRQTCPNILKGKFEQSQIPSFRTIFKITPNTNSSEVTIAAPIAPCLMIDISQGITSFISPIRTKQSPPRRNIDQCIMPPLMKVLNKNSIIKQREPPTVNKVRNLFSLVRIIKFYLLQLFQRSCSIDRDFILLHFTIHWIHSRGDGHR